MKLTFKQLTEIEPRLQNLFDEASKYRPNRARFCANDVWFTIFKPKVIRLVGFYATKQDEVLGTSEAFDVACKTIYDALPSCGECSC